MLRLIATLAVIAVLLGVAERVDPEAGSRIRPDRTQRRVDLAWIAAYVVYVPVVGAAAATIIVWAASAAPLGPAMSGWPWTLRLAGAVMLPNSPRLQRASIFP